MLSLHRLERKQNSFSNAFLIRIFPFLSCSFGIKTINMLISSRSSPENHIRFQTKMGKVYTRFQTKTAQKPYPMGRQISLYKGVPPPPGYQSTSYIIEPLGLNVMTQVKFRRICMESSEHNWPNVSETICPTMLVFDNKASWMFSGFRNILTNPIISQI